MRALACRACGGEMNKTTVSSGNCAGIASALLVLAVGVFLIVFIPVIGWIIGGLMVLVALFMGGKKQKVWRCRRCRCILPRG